MDKKMDLKKYSETQRRYTKTPKGIIKKREQNRRWRAKHKKHVSEYNKKWKEDHPDYWKEYWKKTKKIKDKNGRDRNIK